LTELTLCPYCDSNWIDYEADLVCKDCAPEALADMVLSDLDKGVKLLTQIHLNDEQMEYLKKVKSVLTSIIGE
jgi:hypothetical protein